MPHAYRLGLGETVGLPIAPSIKYGRVVAILKGGRDRYVVREFLPRDGDWPTGPLKTLPGAFVRPWRGGPV